jgi:predicted small lipoprotein YifL
MLRSALVLALVGATLAACGGRPYPPYHGPSAPVAPSPNKVTPPPPPIDVIRPKIP